jgi:hypothetical protein
MVPIHTKLNAAYEWQTEVWPYIFFNNFYKMMLILQYNFLYQIGLIRNTYHTALHTCSHFKGVFF